MAKREPGSPVGHEAREAQLEALRLPSRSFVSIKSQEQTLCSPESDIFGVPRRREKV